MSKFVTYDPKKHKGKKILEIVSEQSSKGNIDMSFRGTRDISIEEAKNAPWYYVIEVT